MTFSGKVAFITGGGSGMGQRMRLWLPNLIWKRIHKAEGI